MCWMCEERHGVSCGLCGRLVCFDVVVGDDIVRPACITDDGELVCDDCARDLEAEADEDEEIYIRCLLEGSA